MHMLADLLYHLDTLVTGASCHPPAIEIVGDIVNEILVIRGYVFRSKHRPGKLQYATSSKKSPSFSPRSDPSLGKQTN